jgi:hypothetical protein
MEQDLKALPAAQAEWVSVAWPEMDLEVVVLAGAGQALIRQEQLEQERLAQALPVQEVPVQVQALPVQALSAQAQVLSVQEVSARALVMQVLLVQVLLAQALRVQILSVQRVLVGLEAQARSVEVQPPCPVAWACQTPQDPPPRVQV